MKDFRLSEARKAEIASKLDEYNKYVSKVNDRYLDQDYIYASGSRTSIQDLRDAGIDVEFLVSPKSLKSAEKSIKSDKGYEAFLKNISDPEAYIDRRTSGYVRNLEEAMMMTFGDEEWRDEFQELVSRLGPDKTAEIIATHQVFSIKYVYHETHVGRGDDIPEKQLEILRSALDDEDDEEED